MVLLRTAQQTTYRCGTAHRAHWNSSVGVLTENRNPECSKCELKYAFAANSNWKHLNGVQMGISTFSILLPSVLGVRK